MSIPKDKEEDEEDGRGSYFNNKLPKDELETLEQLKEELARSFVELLKKPSTRDGQVIPCGTEKRDGQQEDNEFMEKEFKFEGRVFVVLEACGHILQGIGLTVDYLAEKLARGLVLMAIESFSDISDLCLEIWSEDLENTIDQKFFEFMKDVADKLRTAMLMWAQSKSFRIYVARDIVSNFVPPKLLSGLCLKQNIHLFLIEISKLDQEDMKEELIVSKNCAELKSNKLGASDVFLMLHKNMYYRLVPKKDLEKEREKIMKRQKARVFYREGVSDEHIWNYWFGQMRTVGIDRLIQRYQNEEDLIPEIQRGCACYYETQDEQGLWTRFDVQGGEPVVVESFRKRKVALLFQDYLTRIGGDDALQGTIGDQYPAIELFEVVTYGGDTVWAPLCRCKVLDWDNLRTFLEEELNDVRKSLLETFVGQDEAKKALFTKVLSGCMYAQEVGRKFSINEYNMVFLGEPGTGKTTFAQLVGKLLYFCGMLRVGHFVQRTGAEVGQATGNADQTSLFVKRLYQRARDGVLFIDELYGIAPGMDSGTAGTANQIAAIAAITDKSLSERCCTIAAGYPKEVEACFFERNQGLRRRFKSIEFQSYTGWELFQIFSNKASDQKLEFTIGAKQVLLFLFAGFSPSDKRNAAFCNDLVLELHEQIANRKAVCSIEYPFDPEVQPEDVVFVWQSLVPGANQHDDLDQWLKEICDIVGGEWAYTKPVMDAIADSKPRQVQEEEDDERGEAAGVSNQKKRERQSSSSSLNENIQQKRERVVFPSSLVVDSKNDEVATRNFKEFLDEKYEMAEWKIYVLASDLIGECKMWQKAHGKKEISKNLIGRMLTKLRDKINRTDNENGIAIYRQLRKKEKLEKKETLYLK